MSANDVVDTVVGAAGPGARSTARSSARPHGSPGARARGGSGGGSCTAPATRLPSRADSGVTQAAIEVANDFPRNGPSGWYSHAWMSRADQSFTSTTPNTWSGASATGTGTPVSLGTPTT